MKGVRKPRTHRFGQRDRLVWRIDDNGHVFSMTDDRHDLLDLFPGAPVVYDAYLFDGVGLIHVGDSPVGQEVFEIIVIHASGEARYVYDRIYQAQKAVEVGMSLEYTRDNVGWLVEYNLSGSFRDLREVFDEEGKGNEDHALFEIPPVQRIGKYWFDRIEVML